MREPRPRWVPGLRPATPVPPSPRACGEGAWARRLRRDAAAADACAPESRIRAPALAPTLGLRERYRAHLTPAVSRRPQAPTSARVQAAAGGGRLQCVVRRCLGGGAPASWLPCLAGPSLAGRAGAVGSPGDGRDSCCVCLVLGALCLGCLSSWMSFALEAGHRGSRGTQRFSSCTDLPLSWSSRAPWAPNARGEPRPRAAARHERRLLGVGSSAMFK